MPGDRDEDGSTFEPRKGEKLPTAAPPPPAAPAGALAWGECGIRNEAADGGVERYTSGGVSYTAPPLPVVWAAADEHPPRYRMPWPGNPHAARSFTALRRELAAFAGPPPPRALADIDAAARGLAELARLLGEANWSLGLANPDNLFLHPAKGVVPVDLGFAWNGTHPTIPLDAQPGRPDWLNEGHAFEALWPQPSLRQQFAAPGHPQSGGAAGNVAVVGRILAWLVTGYARKTLPPTGPGRPESWAVLADAVAGRIASADDLRARLDAAPLSGCLAPPPPPPVVPQAVVQKPTSRAPLVAAAVVVLALAAVAVWQFTKDDKPVADGGKPPDTETPKDEKKEEKKEEKKDTKKTETPPVRGLAGAIAALKGKYDAATPAERAALAAARAELLAKVEAAIVETQTTAETAIRAGDVERRAALAAELAAVAAALEVLAAVHPAADTAIKNKEQECVTFASTLAVQLGAR